MTLNESIEHIQELLVVDNFKTTQSKKEHEELLMFLEELNCYRHDDLTNSVVVNNKDKPVDYVLNNLQKVIEENNFSCEQCRKDHCDLLKFMYELRSYKYYNKDYPSFVNGAINEPIQELVGSPWSENAGSLYIAPQCKELTLKINEIIRYINKKEGFERDFPYDSRTISYI